MKEGLKDSGLLDNVYLMCQPLGYYTPDAGRQGFIDLPEFPFGLGTQSFTSLLTDLYQDINRVSSFQWNISLKEFLR